MNESKSNWKGNRCSSLFRDRFVDHYKDGDCIVKFEPNINAANNLGARTGYLLIRKSAVEYVMVTGTN